MIVRPRVIPTILLNKGDMVKTTRFSKPDYLGDPINSIKIFNEKGVDELCVLDISATKEGLKPNFELLSEMASQAFMPLSYGGGITSVEQMKRLFHLGFEKVIVNSAWLRNCDLIKEASEIFGSQSVVVAIDYKAGISGKWCYSVSGKKKERVHPVENAVNAERAGAGEVLLYSIDRDGKYCGYDLKTIKEVSKSIHIPLIACGGAACIDDLKKALDSGCDAVAAGSMFVYYGDNRGKLINFPGVDEMVQAGIWSEEVLQFEL